MATTLQLVHNSAIRLHHLPLEESRVSPCLMQTICSLIFMQSIRRPVKSTGARYTSLDPFGLRCLDDILLVSDVSASKCNIEHSGIDSILFSGLAVYNTTHLGRTGRFQMHMPNAYVYNLLLFGVPFVLFCVLLVLA